MNARFDKALDIIKKREERCPGESGGKWFVDSEGSTTLSTFLLTILPCVVPKMRAEWTDPKSYDGP